MYICINIGLPESEDLKYGHTHVMYMYLIAYVLLLLNR